MELLNGNRVLLFFRERALHETVDAAKHRFLTEHSKSYSKENEAIKTKDGVINMVTDGENTLDFSSLAYVDEEGTFGTWAVLEDIYHRNALLEIWEVYADTLNGNEIQVIYYQGRLTSFDQSAPADGQVTLDFSYAINGVGVKGTDTLTESQVKEVESAIYEYEQMKASGVEEV